MATEEEKRIVGRRARSRCEYCKAPEKIAGYAFHIEHILPRKEGGKDELNNYALACMPCNRGKWHYVMGQDPKTKKSERLFHPRKDKWEDHFRITQKLIISGTTPVGRATENRLALNQARQMEARKLWVELDLYP